MPLGFIVNLVAYNLETWPDNTCAHYVRYEGVMTALGVEVVGVMMLIRLHALYYDKSRLVLAFMAFILVAETATNVYLLIHAIPVEHRIYQDQVHACTMIFNSNRVVSAGSAWIPLLYDTLVLVLTLYITIPSIRRSSEGFIVRTILKDGLSYYAVICIVTMVLTIMIAVAPPGLKNITAQLELLLTVTMMSRITIHLKKEFHSPKSARASHRYSEGAINVSFTRERSASIATSRTRSPSYLSSTGHANLGIAFVRPQQAHVMSTIWSERISETPTPAYGLSPTATWEDFSEILSTQVGQPPEDVPYIRTVRRRDEESFLPRTQDYR